MSQNKELPSQELSVVTCDLPPEPILLRVQAQKLQKPISAVPFLEKRDCKPAAGVCA